MGAMVYGDIVTEVVMLCQWLDASQEGAVSAWPRGLLSGTEQLVQALVWVLEQAPWARGLKHQVGSTPFQNRTSRLVASHPCRGQSLASIVVFLRRNN